MYNNGIDGMMKNLLCTTQDGFEYLTTVRSGARQQEMGLLECFVGGMLALGVLHDVNPAMKKRDLATAKALTYTCMHFYFDSATGVAGEVNVATAQGISVSARYNFYIFRPEAIESLYYLNQITGDPIYR